VLRTDSHPDAVDEQAAASGTPVWRKLLLPAALSLAFPAVIAGFAALFPVEPGRTTPYRPATALLTAPATPAPQPGAADRAARPGFWEAPAPAQVRLKLLIPAEEVPAAEEPAGSGTAGNPGPP
jgi:hypothetical protein